eukprot:TRINITY_DN2502_c0_g1_i2.p1 TRINITY_DN2502_c0_g1~~TRINITY_DN2502_c0_g1_i2.p1  ORF type:complete len:584 (-),score=91.24 TRINITY_DN2502_c0_g1_i2:206-1864(-)
MADDSDLEIPPEDGDDALDEAFDEFGVDDPAMSGEEPPAVEEEDDLGDAAGEVGEEDEFPGEEADVNGEDGENSNAHEEEEVDEEFESWKIVQPFGEKFVVRMGKQLTTAKRAESFCYKLASHIDEQKAEDKLVVFEDFDVSQNLIPFDQLEELFATLSDSCVHVERFRLFGVPTFNDDAASTMAAWLAGVCEGNVPFEIHLSDTALTADGYTQLIEAIESNSAFPGPDPRAPRRGKLGMYLRVENNYIEPSAIQRTVDDGTVSLWRKSDPLVHDDNIKVRLMLQQNGSFGQRKGVPPTPEASNRGMHKPVHNWKGKGGKDGGKGKARDNHGGFGGASGGKGGGRWVAPDASSRRSEPPRTRGRERDVRRPPPEASSRSGPRRIVRGGPPPWATQALPMRGSESSRRRPSVPARSAISRPPLNSDRSAVRRGSGRGDYSNGTHERRPNGRRGEDSAPEPYNAFSRTLRGADVRAHDRPSDRSAKRDHPVDREHDPAAKRGRPSSMPSRMRPSKPEGSDKLPVPWETHFSEQYGLFYYWNAKTGQSSWERPAN